MFKAHYSQWKTRMQLLLLLFINTLSKKKKKKNAACVVQLFYFSLYAFWTYIYIYRYLCIVTLYKCVWFIFYNINDNIIHYIIYIILITRLSCIVIFYKISLCDCVLKGLYTFYYLRTIWQQGNDKFFKCGRALWFFESCINI